MERARPQFNKFVLSPIVFVLVLVLVCVRKTEKALRTTNSTYFFKCRQKNKTGNEIRLNIHTNQFNDARKSILYICDALHASAFIDTWILQMKTEKIPNAMAWLILTFSTFGPTPFTLTCQRRSKISHHTDQKKQFLQTPQKIPMVHLCIENNKQQQQQQKFKMFSMAHHKCQVTVLLHNRVMVTTFKLKRRKDQN